MIYTRPMVDRQLTTFIGNREVVNELKALINSKFEGISTLRIEAVQGDGSSYLLHALANEVRKQGIPIIFLHFRKEDKFTDLTTYHMTDILTSPYVFIDNLTYGLSGPEQRTELVKMLDELGKRNAKVFYSCNSVSVLDSRLMFEHSFTGEKLHFYLSKVNAEERKEWAINLMDEATVGAVSEQTFSQDNSNAAFLEILKPYLDKFKLENGNDYEEINKKQEQLYDLEVRLLKTRLATLELTPVKNVTIREQRYEKAADIRDQQKDLESELAKIREELNSMVIDPKPSVSAMRLYIEYVRVQRSLLASEDALFIAVDEIHKQLELLEEKKKALGADCDRNTRLKVFQDIVNWTNTLERFYGNNVRIGKR